MTERQTLRARWDAANLVLGGARYVWPPHEALGQGLKADGVAEVFDAFCAALRDRDFPIELLHDALQADLTCLSGLKGHEALRYERSLEILPKIVEDVLTQIKAPYDPQAP